MIATTKYHEVDLDAVINEQLPAFWTVAIEWETNKHD